MTLDTLIEILEKIKQSSSATQVEVYTHEFGASGYNITSVSATSDGYVIINVEK